LSFSPSDRSSNYIVLEAGIDHLTDPMTAARSANFLFDELAETIARGPIRFHILTQPANDGDTVGDATIHWPEERPRWISVQQKHIIFDPIPRVDEIRKTLCSSRGTIYLLNGRRRRTAG